MKERPIPAITAGIGRFLIGESEYLIHLPVM